MAYSVNSSDGRPEDATSDLGSVHSAGSPGRLRGIESWVVSGLALAWSVFQLYLAYHPINSIIARSVHLTFAVVLVYLAYSARRTAVARGWLSDRRLSGLKVPAYDLILAVLAGCGAAYMAWDYEGIIQRSGLPIERDVIIGTGFILLLLEAARRSLGPALPSLASIFLLYCFAGPWMPRFLAHPGVPLEFVVDHMYLSDSGIWGVPLGVSTSFVFLFVLFGSLLEKAGAAHYFVQVAFAALGRFRGGPAKAAVLASGLTGLVSGSSIANVATTGTFTIPLMKKVGLPAYKAAAVEVGASTNGQLLPPVMGAAAFIMAEFLGLPYLDIVRAAFIPAVVSYIALLYVVHLEALKLKLRPLPSRELPRFWTTFLKGLHFLIPVAALIYTLVILRFSAVAAAFNAIGFTILVILIQRPLAAVLYAVRKMKQEKKVSQWRELADPAYFGEFEDRLWRAALDGLAQSFGDLVGGLVAGAKNMMSIGVATAAAGIIVGTVTLTGLSSRFIEVIEILSMGNILFMLVLAAGASLILGMGLPTTANYIVMATLTAPVIITLGAKADLVIPALAAHLFVFYFGILADDTPPVGLAAFAASAIAGSEPIRTGIQGFCYDLRTAVLPFVFVFNLELLMIAGVSPDGQIIWLESWVRIGWVIVAALVAIFAFAASLQGYLAARCYWWERLLLLAVCTASFRPDLLARPAGVNRVVIQLLAGTLFLTLYLMQVRRERARVEGLD